MRALIIGFGSIGKRHARVLQSLGVDVAVVTSSLETGSLFRFGTVDDALDQWCPDYIVVANRTADHYVTLEKLVGFQGQLLVEKPLLDQETILPAGLPTFWVGYNLRCHPVIDAIRNQLSESEAIASTLCVGQYLPSWRPDSDYKQSYSAHRELGGGVLRDLSHELDLVNCLFGTWRSVVADMGQFGSLEIDVEDVCAALIRTERNSLVSVSMDYLDRYGRRDIVIQTRSGTIHADLVKGVLSYQNQVLNHRVERDQTYIEQHRRILAGETEKLCDAEQALEVMRLIQAIEQSNSDRKWIDRE